MVWRTCILDLYTGMSSMQQSRSTYDSRLTSRAAEGSVAWERRVWSWCGHTASSPSTPGMGLVYCRLWAGAARCSSSMSWIHLSTTLSSRSTQATLLTLVALPPAVLVRDRSCSSMMLGSDCLAAGSSRVERPSCSGLSDSTWVRTQLSKTLSK